LSLTFDHRVADGAVAAQLLEATVKHLNDKKSLTAA
jgi:pyruvate/2-oxoglutarate dehydrogenase complex dihydrolipoamide acyltransferase (E2) component